MSQSQLFQHCLIIKALTALPNYPPPHNVQEQIVVKRKRDLQMAEGLTLTETQEELIKLCNLRGDSVEEATLELRSF